MIFSANFESTGEMDPSIIAWVESGALFVNGHNEVGFPYSRPAALVQKLAAYLGKRHGQTVGQTLENSCRNLFFLSTSVPAVAQSNAAATATGKFLKQRCVYTIQIRGSREEGPAKGRARKDHGAAEGGAGTRV